MLCLIDYKGYSSLIFNLGLLAKLYISCFLFLKKKKFYLFIYLFLAALGLRCCVQAFSSCGQRGLLFVAVCGRLIMVASLVVELRL